MNKLLLSLLGAALLPALTQCNTLEKDIAGINARNAEIARETTSSAAATMYRQRASGDTCASQARLGERPNSSSWMKAPAAPRTACRNTPEIRATPTTTTMNTGYTANTRANTVTNPIPI